MKYCQWIAASLIAAQMGIPSAPAFAGEEEARKQPGIVNRAYQYAKDIETGEVEKTTPLGLATGMSLGGLGGWVLGGNIAIRPYQPVRAGAGITAGVLAFAGITLGVIASLRSLAKSYGKTEFVGILQRTPEYPSLVERWGKRKADQFVEDLFTVYEEELTDEAVTGLLKKYPELEVAVGQKAAVPSYTLSESTRKLIYSGNPLAVLAPENATPILDSSSASKATE